MLSPFPYLPRQSIRSCGPASPPTTVATTEPGRAHKLGVKAVLEGVENTPT